MSDLSTTELLFLLNRATQIGFSIYDQVMAGEMTPEEGLALWKERAAKVSAEESRFDRLMGDN